MRTALSFSLIFFLVLGACQSRWNPVTWFDRDEEVPQGTTNPLLPEDTQGLFSRNPESSTFTGSPVQTVKSVTVSRVTEGALITVVGVPSVHGVHSVVLAPRNDGKSENGVITLDLLAVHPQGAPWGGTEQAREVTVATVATKQQLEGVRTIRVIAASNARQARR
ncbi:hypothetical protein [Pseudopelagicola sp. nBUS_19]|uniref:hypothetical protein n=1 Tax=Pseudopelagicola sp. nBUS_19 TaxID=3395316 RepID=UPI003EBA196A